MPSLALAQEQVAREVSELTACWEAQRATMGGVSRDDLPAYTGRGLPCFFECKAMSQSEHGGRSPQGLALEVREARKALGFWSSFVGLVSHCMVSNCSRRVSSDIIKVREMYEVARGIHMVVDCDTLCPSIATCAEITHELTSDCKSLAHTHLISCLNTPLKLGA
jgi:hypothetical protein